MDLDFSTFVRKPFMVEAVEVTEDNISEIAKIVGGVLRHKDDNTPYITADRRLYPDRIYIGFWMTQMGKNIRCYSGPIFKKQFVESNDGLAAWFKEMSTHLNDGDDENG